MWPLDSSCGLPLRGRGAGTDGTGAALSSPSELLPQKLTSPMGPVSPENACPPSHPLQAISRARGLDASSMGVGHEPPAPQTPSVSLRPAEKSESNLRLSPARLTPDRVASWPPCFS